MRAVVQRVSWAKVSVEGRVVGAIGPGLCVLVGVGRTDVDDDARLLARKVSGLRIFEDDQGKMNRSVIEMGGALLAVSQFTLFGDARKGRRPSFTEAMEPGRAAELFGLFCEECGRSGIRVERGQFQAHMLVELANDGPVTLLLDSARTF
jgi:D-tyrosyl-tRNA(Tyr) deacylase